MNIIKLYEDFNIPIAGTGERHYQEGWVNTPCPFCTGNPGNHLGYNLDGGYFHCFRCGGHFTDSTLVRLIGITQREARQLIKQYGGVTERRPEPVVTIQKKPFKLPSDIIPLTNKHKHYLEERGFDPDLLEYRYKLQSTGPLSTLDDIDYKHRIVIPIFWNGKIVSFQTRSTKDEKLKYISCPKDRELIHHKDIMYIQPNSLIYNAIIVEGVTDVWRFGLGNMTHATFGIEYTYIQLKLIASSFKRVAVVFDDESQAIKQANELVDELKFRKVDAWRVPIVGDPASMSQADADHLINDLIKTRL